MESTTVTPQPGQTVVMTDHDEHGHHRGHHDHSDWDRTILREQAAGFREAASARNEQTRDTLDTRHDLSQISERGFSASALASCHLSEKVAQASKEAAVASKDQLVTAYQIEGRSQVQAEKLAAAAVLQAEKLAAASVLQAEKLASAAALQAQQIASTAAAQLAECCCELREKITADGNSTRAVLESNERERLRDRAARAEATLSAYFTRAVPPVVPQAT